MRHALKKARLQLGITQKNAAAKIGISLRYYQDIEDGRREGRASIWDSLEDLFSVPQRELRENVD